ncbi:D-glucuronyl C5-epimerase family protein [bacterium]|nr:D-glucuronyl C5-epimerase family protein [bacterium]
MVKKLKTDVFNKQQPYPNTKNLSSQQLDEYYFVFEESPAKLNKLISTFDENGIPLNSAYIDVKEPKLHYYPISIGQYGLAVFHSWLKDKSTGKKAHFLRIADWFYENRTEDERLGVYWLTAVPKPEYRIEKSWKSAFSQSRGLSVLLRAWQLSGDDKLLELCKKALIPFTFDIADGGVTANLKDGHPFYEEYVAAEPTMVLDGHIFSLFGIYDFVRAVPPTVDKNYHELAKKLFNDGIESLIYRLPQFDMGYWLRFNLCQMEHYPAIDPCTIGYLRLVINQLEVLYDITKNEELKKFKNRIVTYNRIGNILRMYLVKYKALKKLSRI